MKVQGLTPRAVHAIDLSPDQKRAPVLRPWSTAPATRAIDRMTPDARATLVRALADIALDYALKALETEPTAGNTPAMRVPLERMSDRKEATRRPGDCGEISMAERR